MADVNVTEDSAKDSRIVFNIKNVPKAYIEEQYKNNTEILRDIVKPEDVKILRKTDEGKKGVFDRTDIKVNYIETKIDYNNISTGKDINFNNSKQKTPSETERTVSGLTEEMIDCLFENKGEKSSIELVEHYLDQLVDMKDDNSIPAETPNKKRSLSISSHSSDESVLNYYRKNKNAKRFRDSSSEHTYKYPKRKRNESRMSRLSRKSFTISEKKHSDSRNSKKLIRKRNRSFTSSDESHSDYFDNFDTKSKRSYKCSCPKCEKKDKYRPSTSYSRSSKSKCKDYSYLKEKSSIDLKYHKYNAAMYAVSVILEIIKKDFRSKKSKSSDDDSSDEDVEMKYHRYNAAMYAVSVILEIIKHN